MGEKGKTETMRNVTKACGESERVGSIVVSVYTKLIIRTSNLCRWLVVSKYPPLATSTSVNNCYIKKPLKGTLLLREGLGNQEKTTRKQAQTHPKWKLSHRAKVFCLELACVAGAWK